MKSLAAAVAGLAVIALAGCSYVNPITTQEYYAASDGVHLPIDDVEAQNLIVFTTGEGEPGALVGSIVNRGTEDVLLNVSFDGETATTITAPAGQSVILSPVDGIEVLGNSPTMPGRTTQVGFSTPEQAFFTLNAPVLDGTLPQYAEIIEALG